jgi:DNA-binding IclR family transcriptional regulator
VIELLARSPQGLPLGEIAKRLNMPPSATHRTLTELVSLGYLRHNAELGSYALSMKMISLSLGYLSEVDLVDCAKPAIDRLAAESEALARLAIPDQHGLTWVLKSQGARSNIRYDPPMNYSVRLSCSAGGHAWLSQLEDDQALALVLGQGIGIEGYGPEAPRTTDDVMKLVRQARSRGYAVLTDAYEANIAAIAVPIVNPELQRATGVLSVAGPKWDLSPEKLERLVPALRKEADELSTARLDYAAYLLPVRKPCRKEQHRDGRHRRLLLPPLLRRGLPRPRDRPRCANAASGVHRTGRRLRRGGHIHRVFRAHGR